MRLFDWLKIVWKNIPLFLVRDITINLALLQQRGREILLLEERTIAISTKSKAEYEVCQNNIMSYARENNEYLERVRYL